MRSYGSGKGYEGVQGRRQGRSPRGTLSHVRALPGALVIDGHVPSGWTCPL